ncbi:MAG: hypothetical protein CSA20_08335 [Deltaproteobacteria bacterium]|nr:MAG: hypothetical protein CSA20_08335 [Deltaproteobacteria bacterium]
MTSDLLSLERMQLAAVCLLLVMTLVAAVFGSFSFSISVLVGGGISVGSFWIANKDIVRLVESVTALAGLEEKKARSRQQQKGYLLRFWVRIVVIGLVLAVLVKWRLVNVFGLILGLSTVVLLVSFFAVGMIWRYYAGGR